VLPGVCINYVTNRKVTLEGQGQKSGACATVISARSVLMSTDVESLTTFIVFCMASVHKWKVCLF